MRGQSKRKVLTKRGDARDADAFGGL